MLRYSQFHADPPYLKIFCSKSYLKRPEFEKTMKTIDYKVDQHLCRNIKGSRTAFVCVDSLATVIALKKIIK